MDYLHGDKFNVFTCTETIWGRVKREDKTIGEASKEKINSF